MSDDIRNSQENDSQNEQPPLPPSREPEGGPFERQRSFLEERLTPLGPKDADRGAPRLPDILPGPPDEEAPRDIDAPPTESRRDLIQEYHERLQEELEAEKARDIGERDLGAPPPPQAPDAPPSNNWIPIGPSVLRQGQGGVKPATSGRTPAIAIAPGGNRIYIGAANGGVWCSEDTGNTWVSLMDAFDLNPTTVASDSLAVGAIALVAGATASQDRIYVGSGEGAGGAYFGVGPILSTDGGASWITEPVAPGSPALTGSAFYALAVDPADTNRVVGATRQGIFRREPVPAPGIGFHWAQKNLPGAGSGWATSVVATRSGGTTTFYAATWFGPVFSSTDGHTWAQVGAGFPGAGVSRIALAAQPNNPNVLYAFTAEGNVYRLDVSDGNWIQVTGLTAAGSLVSSQGWYDLAIAVAPNNVNRIYLGGSTVSSGGDWSGALYRSELTITSAGGSITGASASNTYIGGSVHADIHTIVFSPNDANKLWVGCDGGVYYTTNPTSSGNIFNSCNIGLQTMTMNYLGQHPTEDAVLFCGTQDNGGERFTGEEAWLYTSGGDSGYFIVNWNNPYKVLDTYVRGTVRRSTDGGTRYSYSSVSVPLAGGEQVLFYAPIAGAPRNTAPGSAAEAEIVAFGSIRPWISTTFGGGWQSIPNGNLAQDSLNERIKSLCFASATKLYAGTMAGGVYRFDKAGASWSRTRLDTLGLPLAGVVTDIAIDLTDATGNSIYITFGGSGDYRHVWHFDGTNWQQRSGPAAGAATALLDVQHTAIVVDPAYTQHVYVGADIGIWRSTNGGSTWATFSGGLPDAGVMDLKLHAGRRLLRASTHGRSVFERTLDTLPKQGVELYVRDTQLDQGRFTTINNLPDPTDMGEVVRHWRGPDIKLDTPDISGQYQFPLTGDIDFHEFVDTLSDDSKTVATHATATITTRVYVQVHNRGVLPATNVQVMLLLSNASAGLPALPAGYETDVQTGTPINTANWKTIGIETLNNVRVGFPKIAAFNLTSDKLPPPASLAGNDHHCVLALVHHANDPYTSTQTNTDANSKAERKAAHKNLKVVQFTGTLPSPPPTIMPFRIHNADLERLLLTDLIIDLRGYPGRLRLFIPPMKMDGHLEELSDGMFIDQDFEYFKRWAESHFEMIERNQAGNQPYNREWSEQRIKDIHLALETGVMLEVEDRKRVALRRIVMEPDSYHTIFLMIDRPQDAQIGSTFDIEVQQWNHEKEELLGGLDFRVELQPEPQQKKYRLKLWSHDWLRRYKVIRANLYDADGEVVSIEDGVEVRLMLKGPDGASKDLGLMRWHRGWRSFYYYLRAKTPTKTSVIAIADINGKEVAEAELNKL